jgi:metal-responsive CopG/Arc/MetJ family transcriptional regulator
MSKAKITVTIEEELIKEIDRTAESLKENRSYLVEQAIRTWKRVKLQEELRQGYLAMATEDLATAEKNLPAGFEVLK